MIVRAEVHRGAFVHASPARKHRAESARARLNDPLPSLGIRINSGRRGDSLPASGKNKPGASSLKSPAGDIGRLLAIHLFDLVEECPGRHTVHYPLCILGIQFNGRDRAVT